MWRLQRQVKHVGSAALGDVIFNPVTASLPTGPGWRQGDTDSTTDLGLVSPRIVPWLSQCRNADTTRKRPSAWVFSLQRAAKKQNIKSHNPFRCERWVQTLCENCKGKPRTQIMKGSRKKQEAATMVDQ